MVDFQLLERTLRVSSPVYSWEWDEVTDLVSIYDGEKRLIGQGHHQPLVLTRQSGPGFLASSRSFQIDGDIVVIVYEGVNDKSKLTATWRFKNDFICFEPLIYESRRAEDILQIVYFPVPDAASYRPSFYSRYAVIPGLSMTTNISPVVDLHSRLSVNAVLGSGAMRGPGFTQQWGLPAHYFCIFNTAERWNAAGAKQLQSGAACWGLAALPDGDFRLEIREIGLSPILNVRSDLWRQHKTPGKIRLGCSFLITFGSQFHEAIRNYYKVLLREKRIEPKRSSQKKNEILLAPQYNTWGVQSAKGLLPEDLTEALVREILDTLQKSGMKARTFVIDDKWEGQYGELKHDGIRFPKFAALLRSIRNQGYFVGLWAAFLRCENPSTLGLNESHLLQTPEGKPLWLVHQGSRYGIFDITQPVVERVLEQRAKQFVRRYQPDLIKFDFGYELPSLDIAAPMDMNWAGERLLRKGLDVILGAMREEKRDLVVMYYGLSPLLSDHYDLHSPDDLVYCGGDYDLETNRRIFFSSLCGELGMPTYGSSGYDWESAPDIWFDSAPSGTLGSLHCFEGDENGDKPRQEWIAIYNGLSAILRKASIFQINPIGAKWQGGLRAAFSPSWERLENDRTVLLALRTYRFDGKPAICSYKHVLHTDVMLVVASLTDDEIPRARRIGLVPFDDGRCTLQVAHHGIARVVEHYLSGAQHETKVACEEQCIRLSLRRSRDHEILEWIEVIFTEKSPHLERQRGR